MGRRQVLAALQQVQRTHGRIYAFQGCSDHHDLGGGTSTKNLRGLSRGNSELTAIDVFGLRVSPSDLAASLSKMDIFTSVTCYPGEQGYVHLEMEEP